MAQELSTQRVIEFDSIKEGVIVLKDGSLRQILMVSGVNFDLKSEDEQNVILYSFQSFLNALDFPIQILIHSRKLNIDAYLEMLSGRERQEPNELLKNQIAEYQQFIKTLVEGSTIMSKTFFVVVPYEASPISLEKGVKSNIKGLFGGLLGKEKTPQTQENFEAVKQQLFQRTDQVINGLRGIGLRAIPLEDQELTELFYNLYNPEKAEKEKLTLNKE